MLSKNDLRAFLKRRVIANSELVLAYAELSGQDPLQVIRTFAVKPTLERGTCEMKYVTRMFGYQCSACKKITRSAGGERFDYCPRCGASNIGK